MSGAVKTLQSILDRYRGRYRELADATDFRTYVERGPVRDDEQILTEPVMAEVVEDVLGFPVDAYFPQFAKSGLKPDLTPLDVIAHPFVFDAKSTNTSLSGHEEQIRRYVDQRQLDYGVLFNLREIKVYRRGGKGADPDLSFFLLPVWEVARGEALPGDEFARFEAFVERFGYREMTLADKIERVREAEPWALKEARGEGAIVDVDFVVERLRALSTALIEDAHAQYEALRRHLDLNPGREEALLKELRLLALDIAPGTDPAVLPASVEAYRTSLGLPRRVWQQYLLRCAHLALARIVLYRSWEDSGFVSDYLYDGGFGEVYERVNRNLGEVLQAAFAEGSRRYRWLYGGDNNYDWYRPRDAALVEVLYALTPVPLGKLDADVLGGLYEAYVDEIDRDRLGQFYTPRAVVRFMLDQAGFVGASGVFRLEGDKRKARQVFDFATGSGGFLVEAARRVIDDGGIDPTDAEGMHEALAAIVAGFHGSEISPFPYYLTEINILLQVSRLLGRLRASSAAVPAFVLGVVPADTLAARGTGDRSFDELDATSRKDRAGLDEDDRVGLVPMDFEKRAAFERIRTDAAFDLVVGNPPYVFESNNQVLFERLRQLSAWKDVYRGKSDYLYYFLLLAAEKVVPGGHLCVITPAGWMNAGNADWLRAAMAANLTIDRLFLFGSYRLFAPERASRADHRHAPTPTVESLILIATKAAPPAGHDVRIVALEDEVQAAKRLNAVDALSPDRDVLLAEMAARADGPVGRADGIHVHDVPQASLKADHPWPVKYAAEDVAARVVEHLQAALDDPDAPVEPLERRWHTFQGIQTGADAFSPRIQRRLERQFPEALEELRARGAKPNAPVMELPAGREAEPPWRDHPHVLARSMEPQAIFYGAIDASNYTSLVWLGRDDEAPDAVIEELSRWRPLLSRRAEFARNPGRRWWETAWPRDKEAMRGPKVIALYRTDRGRFALDEEGAWQPSIKTTLSTPREDGLSVAYLCGLLNSELLDLWYAIRGKNPRDVWRNYEPKPMNRIPYRHVAGGDAESPGAVRVQEALQAGSADLAAVAAHDLAASLRSGDADDAGALRAIEVLVRALRDNRRALLRQRPRARRLERVIRDPWRTAPIEVDSAVVLAGTAEAELVSVRIDPDLQVQVDSDGVLGRRELTPGGLRFVHGRRQTALVTGPPERLALLDEVLGRRRGLLASELNATMLPKDLTAFEARRIEVEDEIERLVADGRQLVEAIERLVCALYGVPSELTDDVVAHAISRAGSREVDDPPAPSES